MDDLAIGRLFRELRIRLGWPQRVAAAKAGIARSSYSEIEHGLIGKVPIAKLRKVSSVYEVRLRLEPSWRGAAIDIVMSSRHAAMAERVTKLLREAGWEVRPEVSFNHFGERGVVDLLAWHAESRTLLVVEVKTELADVHNLLAVNDRRRRLAPKIAEPFGWQPLVVAQWVVVAESGRTNAGYPHTAPCFVRHSLRMVALWADGWRVRAVPWRRSFFCQIPVPAALGVLPRPGCASGSGSRA